MSQQNQKSAPGGRVGADGFSWWSVVLRTGAAGGGMDMFLSFVRDDAKTTEGDEIGTLTARARAHTIGGKKKKEAGALGTQPDSLRNQRLQHDDNASVLKVASQIAVQLGAKEKEALTRIRWSVWELGRMQAQALCAEALSQKTDDDLTLVERFFALVTTKGIKKKRTWATLPDFLLPAREQERIRKSIDAIAEQLQESDEVGRQTLARSVRMLGVEKSLALLHKTQEIEAQGGVMVADGSRRRTPGGVFFGLVRRVTTEHQRQLIFGSRAKNSESPDVEEQTQQHVPG